MRNVTFSTEGFYHIYNRGTEKRNIFLTNGDYYRFMQILYEFNDVQHDLRPCRRSYVACAERAMSGASRRPIVSILCFVLMPNHFHLLLQPRTTDGISTFMHKLGTGYTNYFNLRRKRTGRLFESTFKARPVTSDKYLQHLTRYLHLNPLSLINPDWKERGIQNQKHAEQYLRGYRWSSFSAYADMGGAQFLLDRKRIADAVGDRGQAYVDFVLSWTRRDFQNIAPSWKELSSFQ